MSTQNIGRGYSLEPPRRGGSNEYPQSIFLSRKKKNNVYSCKSQLYNIKVGFKGVKVIKVCFRDVKAVESRVVQWQEASGFKLYIARLFVAFVIGWVAMLFDIRCSFLSFADCSAFFLP